MPPQLLSINVYSLYIVTLERSVIYYWGGYACAFLGLGSAVVHNTVRAERRRVSKELNQEYTLIWNKDKDSTAKNPGGPNQRQKKKKKIKIFKS